jgi:hypothetical protein
MNRIRNASFLDGATDWTRSPTGALTAFEVDESVRGSPGRAVLVASGVTTAADQQLSISTAAASGVEVTPGETIRAETWFWSSHAASVVALFYTAGGVQVGAPVAVPTKIQPGSGRRGLPALFGRASGSIVVPATAATARISLRSTVAASGTAVALALLKPSIAAAGDVCRVWTPGPHTSSDLDLLTWPTTLPRPRELNSPRTPTRRMFEADNGVPSAWRIAARGRVRATFELKLDLEQRDALLQFHETITLASVVAPFWFTNPDTHELCRAWFDPEDGDPQDSGSGPERRTRVGLLLEVA